MRTTYLTTLTTTFNPFSRTSGVPRLFLQLLPVKAHKDIKITQTVLPRTSTQPATLELGFKDGAKMKYTWTERVRTPKAAEAEAGSGKVEDAPTQLSDIVEEVNRHARILGRKEELQG